MTYQTRELPSSDFAETVSDLRLAIGEAVTAFLAERGITADWLAFYRETSTDWEHATRELLIYAADIWPVTDL